MPGDDLRSAAARRDDGVRKVRTLTWRAGAAGVICSAVIALALGHHAQAAAPSRAPARHHRGPEPAARARAGRGARDLRRVMTAGPVAQDSFGVFGTTAVLLVTDPAALAEARAIADRELAAVDLAASRFRPDSELTALNAAGGAAAAGQPAVRRPPLSRAAGRRG